MSKRDKNFRLSKQTKRTMATIVDPVVRHAYKNAMIDAQISAETLPVKSKNKREASL